MRSLIRTLRPGPRIAGGYPRIAHNSPCNDSDGANFCDCQDEGSNIESCMFYRRFAEPLAFSLTSKPVLSQDQCPLYAAIPREVRDMIYEYAFTDCITHPVTRNSIYCRNKEIFEDHSHLPDIATKLLQTCRAVYLEAYQLPLLLNPLKVFDLKGPILPRLRQLPPWQFALIQSVDVSLQQISLEGGKFDTFLENWQAQSRHTGAYVAPRYYREIRRLDLYLMAKCFNFGLVDAARTSSTSMEDGVVVSLPHRLTTFYDRERNIYPIPSTRAMVARPLTRLTLRLTKTDWWSWADSDFNTTIDSQQLRLDPALSDGQNWTTMTMQRLADQRRVGQHPQYANDTWGATIARLPDLKVLELVLETFDVKKHQLESVVESAKTWKFPLNDTGRELAWNGKVEEASWSIPEADVNRREEDLRIHTDRRNSADAETERDQRMGSNSYIGVDMSDSFTTESDHTVSEDVEDVETERSSSENDESYWEDVDDYEEEDDDATAGAEHSWDQTITDFEVRVVRFVRQKAQ